jgi:hypothetical protein
MPFWSATSTTLANDQMYVNNTYKDANGNNKLTTISSANTTGYIPIDSNSTDPIVQKTSYAVQNDGKITYQYDDGTGNKIQYNSIQEIANDFGISGYTEGTTAKIKDSMQKNLSASATEQKVGPSTATSGGNTGGDTNKNGESDKYDPKAIADTQKTAQQNIDELKSGIGDGGSRKDYPKDLRYPEKMDTKKQDYVMFSMLKYEPSGINLNNAATKDSILTRSTAKISNSIGTVTMAIQGPINDMNTVGWNEGNMNPVQALAGATALALIGGGAEGASGAVSSISQLVSDQNKALKTATKAYFAGQAVQNNEIFTRTTGAIANPNIELLFNAPQLREFTFTFILSPRNTTESDSIRKIIRFFKQGMSVKKASTGLFLKTPNTFLITYKQKDSDAKYLPKIKECALQSFGVNYTPAQNYATFYNNSMTAYELTMQFKELTPIYDNDYTDLDQNADTYIGY